MSRLRHLQVHLRQWLKHFNANSHRQSQVRKEPWLHAQTQALINKLNRSCTTLTISHDIMYRHSFFSFFEGHRTVSFMLVIRDFIEMLLPAFRKNFNVHVEIKQTVCL